MPPGDLGDPDIHALIDQRLAGGAGERRDGVDDLDVPALYDRYRRTIATAGRLGVELSRVARSNADLLREQIPRAGLDLSPATLHGIVFGVQLAGHLADLFKTPESPQAQKLVLVTLGLVQLTDDPTGGRPQAVHHDGQDAR